MDSLLFDFTLILFSAPSQSGNPLFLKKFSGAAFLQYIAFLFTLLIFLASPESKGYALKPGIRQI
jgi:hypothetical protein